MSKSVHVIPIWYLVLCTAGYASTDYCPSMWFHIKKMKKIFCVDKNVNNLITKSLSIHWNKTELMVKECEFYSWNMYVHRGWKTILIFCWLYYIESCILWISIFQRYLSYFLKQLYFELTCKSVTLLFRQSPT